MSFIHCSCDCLYQRDGYCGLEKAAEITSDSKDGGCLHFVPSKSAEKNERGPWGRKKVPTG